MSPSATHQSTTRPSPNDLLSELMASPPSPESLEPPFVPASAAPNSPQFATHPTDSSRILLGLMALARRAEEDLEASAFDSLSTAISRQVLRSLLSTLHHRHAPTTLHCRRVALLCVGMGKYLGWKPDHLKMLEVAALLHDIGKVGVPDHILLKPGKLSPDEAELMALHHNIAIDVLQACRVHEDVLDIVIQSHLHFNAAPDGFRKPNSQLHHGARILAVADAYDSLTSDQVYRKGKRHREALEVLIEASGTQFDGNVVLSLARWIEAEGLPFDKDRLPPKQNLEWRGPLTPDEVQEANTLCHIFSYLYVLESLYDGFYVVDADRRYVIWNCGAERLLGYSPYEMTNHTWSSRQLKQASFNQLALPDKECPLNIVMKAGQPQTNIMQWQHKNGCWVETETQSVPLIGPDGQLHGVAEIFRDLSRSSRRPLEYRELKLAASRDPLTSVANRGELETQLTLLTNDFAQKKKDPFSVIFLDLDHLKSINDTYGLRAGDQVLVEMARVMQQETSSGELVGRYGGEEFLILCPSTKLKQAQKRAERFRQAINRKEVAHLSGKTITASFGVAQSEPGDSVASLLRRADRALSVSKESGRNCTTTLTTEEFLNGVEPRREHIQEFDDPLVYHTTFLACVAAELIVYKMGGFVVDQQAKLVDANSQEAILHLGSGGILGGWGSTPDRQPISLHVRFAQTSQKAKPAGASAQVPIDVTIRPRGRIGNQEIFQSRAKRVIKALREYFAAD